MANYYEKARTNYFSVKDSVEFNKYLDLFGTVDVVVQEETGQVALLFDEESGIPSFYLNDDDEDIEVDFIGDVSKHLSDDSIAIFMASGSEGMRYVFGWATAVNNKNERVAIDLNGIYSLATQKFGKDKKITLAEY